MGDLGGVLVSAARLLARHWPALLTLALLAAALRSAAIWAAVEVSDVNGQLAQVLLLLAPLGYLLPLIGMLVVCRRSLPRLVALDRRTSADTATEHRPRRLVDIAVSVLVPFLAVYQSYRLLEQDVFRFRNQAAYDEANRISFSEDLEFDFAGRLGILSLQVALLVVLVAWVVRWALGRAERATKLLAFAYVGALVELYYTSQLSQQVLVFRTSGLAWLGDRVAVQWFEDAYAAVLDAVGFAGRPRSSAVVGAVTAVLSSLDAVVVVPVAYLTVALVVLGHKVADETTAESSAGGRRPLPKPQEVRRGVLRSVMADVRERFSALISALRLLASAGLGPMLVFCLTMLVVSRVPVLVSHAAREVTGSAGHRHLVVRRAAGGGPGPRAVVDADGPAAGGRGRLAGRPPFGARDPDRRTGRPAQGAGSST